MKRLEELAFDYVCLAKSEAERRIVDDEAFEIINSYPTVQRHHLIKKYAAHKAYHGIMKETERYNK